MHWAKQHCILTLRKAFSTFLSFFRDKFLLAVTAGAGLVAARLAFCCRFLFSRLGPLTIDRVQRLDLLTFIFLLCYLLLFMLLLLMAMVYLFLSNGFEIGRERKEKKMSSAENFHIGESGFFVFFKRRLSRFFKLFRQKFPAGSFFSLLFFAFLINLGWQWLLLLQTVKNLSLLTFMTTANPPKSKACVWSAKKW